jgi:death-on-curing protein
MSFGGQELYPTLESKAAAICYSLVMNHPFVDGNKRVGYAALETFLVLNGLEIVATVDDAESIMLSLAAGDLPRDEFTNWVIQHTRAKA